MKVSITPYRIFAQVRAQVGQQRGIAEAHTIAANYYKIAQAVRKANEDGGIVDFLDILYSSHTHGHEAEKFVGMRDVVEFMKELNALPTMSESDFISTFAEKPADPKKGDDNHQQT